MGFHGLPLDTVQREELFLTAAQSFFAVAVLSNLSMSLREAASSSRCSGASSSSAASCPSSSTAWSGSRVGIVYLVLGVWVLVSDRFNFRELARDAFRAPYDELAPSVTPTRSAAAARRQV